MRTIRKVSDISKARKKAKKGYRVNSLGVFKEKRKFSGEIFNLSATAPYKYNAKRKAKILRETLNKKARVVKTKSGYAVYTRKK